MRTKTTSVKRSVKIARARATASALLRAGVTGGRRSVGQDSGALLPAGHNRSRMLAITYPHFNRPCERKLVERLWYARKGGANSARELTIAGGPLIPRSR